ncbi:MAG: hypothetical protein SFX72_17100 [Isosphaeraceae bacterium]|nr:hypothetical protein [Isosphaeraceae bacterium]
MRFSMIVPGLVITAAAIACEANASIVGGAVTGGSAHSAGGTFKLLTVPLANPFGPANSVGQNNFQSVDLYGFDEKQSVVLPVDQVVDVGASPIPGGTVVASHYVFFDPAGSNRLIGSVTFGTKILGILTSRSNLDATDGLVNPGVNYLDPNARGLESNDSVTILDDFTIAWDTTAASPGDYVRVFTVAPVSAVPEPASIVSAIFGATALATVMRSRITRRRGA